MDAPRRTPYAAKRPDLGHRDPTIRRFREDGHAAHLDQDRSLRPFGTKLTNARWSWSGLSEEGDVVALVLWKDAVKVHGGVFSYADDDDPDAEWRRRPGHAERVRHLVRCRDDLEGRFRAVIARAVDVGADPREIASCYPQEGVWWQLDDFDEATGAFTAHVAT